MKWVLYQEVEAFGIFYESDQRRSGCKLLALKICIKDIDPRLLKFKFQSFLLLLFFCFFTKECFLKKINDMDYL